MMVKILESFYYEGYCTYISKFIFYVNENRPKRIVYYTIGEEPKEICLDHEEFSILSNTIKEEML